MITYFYLNTEKDTTNQWGHYKIGQLKQKRLKGESLTNRLSGIL